MLQLLWTDEPSGPEKGAGGGFILLLWLMSALCSRMLMNPTLLCSLFFFFFSFFSCLFLLYPWASTPVPPVSVSVRSFLFVFFKLGFFFFIGGGSWAVIMSHLVLCTIQMFLEAGFIFNNSLSSWLTTFLSNCSHGLWSPFLTDADLICFSDSTVLPFPFPSELSALSFCFFLYTQQNQIPQTWLALPCKGEFCDTQIFNWMPSAWPKSMMKSRA